MPGRLPTQSDFPANLTVSITPPPASKPASNILVLLHGLGDSAAPFATLGSRLALPETACISLQGPTPLPFDLGGFHWGDDIVFDQGSGAMEFDTGFGKATRMLGEDVIMKVLVGKCGFSSREVFIFGFGQGGMVGIDVARRLSGSGDGEMGGLVDVGGPVPGGSTKKDDKDGKCKTPVLVLHGESRSLIDTAAAKAVKDVFEHATIHTWRRPGDAMPSSRDEMLPIMQFFARLLRSQAGVPRGSREIT